MMNRKILIVCSFNKGQISPFVKEQVESLIEYGYRFDYFLIEGKGVIGYLKNTFRLYKYLRNNESYKFIHAHYGYSGLLAVLQRKIPVVVTFHGTDISNPKARILSFLASRLSAINIFVHPDQPNKLMFDIASSHIVPCGINLNLFYPLDKKYARKNE